MGPGGTAGLEGQDGQRARRDRAPGFKIKKNLDIDCFIMSFISGNEGYRSERGAHAEFSLGAWVVFNLSFPVSQP